MVLYSWEMVDKWFSIVAKWFSIVGKWFNIDPLPFLRCWDVKSMLQALQSLSISYRSCRCKPWRWKQSFCKGKIRDQFFVLLISTPFEHKSSSLFRVQCHISGDNWINYETYQLQTLPDPLMEVNEMLTVYLLNVQSQQHFASFMP